MKTLSSTIHLRCVRFASHYFRGLDKPSPFFTANASFLNCPLFTEKFDLKETHLNDGNYFEEKLHHRSLTGS